MSHELLNELRALSARVDKHNADADTVLAGRICICEGVPSTLQLTHGRD